MILKEKISVKRLQEVLSYNPLTGSLMWKKATAKYDRTGTEAAMKPDYRGYRIISLDKQDYMAQRVAWILMTGEVPDGKITFKDGNRSNIKWDNLVLNRGIRGYDSQTPEGRSAYAKAWRKNNPGKYKDKVLRESFGISLRQYEDMLIAQNGCCAICNQRETMKRKGKDVALAVDHCHETGDIRGLLCTACNKGIGLFADSIKNLQSAASYLAKHKEKKMPATNVISIKGA